MPDELAVKCFRCGCDLGMWSPGAIFSCWHCGQQIVVRAQSVGLGEALLTAGVILGAGVVIGALAAAGLKALGDFLDSL